MNCILACVISLYQPMQSSVQRGDLVAAPYVDTTESFYRAHVENVQLQNVAKADGAFNASLIATVSVWLCGWFSKYDTLHFQMLTYEFSS